MLDSLIKTFKENSIDYSYPGFYNDPQFIKKEETDSLFLQKYGLYVKLRKYEDEYLQSVRRIVPQVVEKLYRELELDGRKGACVDMSLSIMKILEKHDIWCVAVAGSMNTIFPVSANIQNMFFWHFDIHPQGKPVPGHVWCYCPPYEIVDLTIRQQLYECGQENYLPAYILNEHGEPFLETMTEVYSPEYRELLKTQGVKIEQYANQNPNFRTYMNPLQCTFKNTKNRYIPYSFTFPGAVEIEEMLSMTFSGKSLSEIYQSEIIPIFND